MVSAVKKIDELSILSRAIRPDSGDWPAEIADGILNITLAEEDRDRMNVLAARARTGNLSEEERVEVEVYMQATSLIELLQAKARASVGMKPGLKTSPKSKAANERATARKAVIAKPNGKKGRKPVLGAGKVA